MMHAPVGSVLIIDAGIGVVGDVAHALNAAGWPATVISGATDQDQAAQIQDFASGIDEGTTGNIVYLFDHLAGSETPIHAQLGAQALELAPKIRLNAICPGPVVPRGDINSKAGMEQWSSPALGIKVPIEEIVGAIGFIIDTPSITGQVIALDGRVAG